MDPIEPREVSPLDIRFRRQAVRRLVFDGESAIGLSTLHPSEIIDLAMEYPTIHVSGTATEYESSNGLLTASASGTSKSALWVGGFNPFATYDVSFDETHGDSPKAGIDFATPDSRNRMSILAGFSSNRCTSIHWQVIVGGEEKQSNCVELDDPVEGPFTLRVQVLGTGLNVYVVQHGVNRVVDTRDFSEVIDLRRKEHIQSFEFRWVTQLAAGERVVIKEAGASLTTGAGQADICAMTYRDGSPILDQGRLWFAMSVRGRVPRSTL